MGAAMRPWRPFKPWSTGTSAEVWSLWAAVRGPLPRRVTAINFLTVGDPGFSFVVALADVYVVMVTRDIERPYLLQDALAAVRRVTESPASTSPSS